MNIGDFFVNLFKTVWNTISWAWGDSPILGIWYAVFWLCVFWLCIWFLTLMLSRLIMHLSPKGRAELKKLEEKSGGGPIFYDRYPFF